MTNQPTRQQLQQALDELRQQRQHFSDAAFAHLERLLQASLREATLRLQNGDTPTDEIRLVSVMFVDVKDSTHLARELEAGDWKTIISRAHTLIEGAVMRWDGQIGQYLGDGVLCFFGAQHSRSDDAIHAVSCALTCQRVLNEYTAQVAAEYGVDFTVRIGISTGRVIVGMIGSETKQELLALGPATHRAARLQHHAPLGGVLIDESTYTRIQDKFITQWQAPVDIKGFEDAVDNYLVVAHRTSSPAALTESTLNGIKLPLVGRDASLAHLQALCDYACDHHTLQAATIRGDAGIGKSRLLQELVHSQNRRCFPVMMVGRYQQRDQSYNLLANLLQVQCQLHADLRVEVVRERIITFATNMWSHPDAEQAAYAMGYLAGYDFPAVSNALDGVLRWFAGLASQQPLLVIVDDLHWADADSLRLLDALADTLADEQAVMLGATRPGYREAAPAYTNAAYHEWLSLERLDEAPTAQLIEAVLQHVQRVPEDIATHVQNRSEGNPLFVREFLRMLFEQDVFVPVEATENASQQWRFNIILYDVALNTTPLPLINVLQARLDELAADVRHVLQMAAIVGQRFWAGAVHAMSDDPSHIDAHLATLQAKGWVVAADASTFPETTEYRFRHTLYRTVAYDMLPRQQRTRYHTTVSHWLVQRVADTPQFYPLLAEHFLLAESYDAALITYLEAVEDHMRRGELVAALALVDSGLAMARHVPRENAIAAVSKLWAARGQALVALGRYNEASAACQSALMLLDELPDDALTTTHFLAERTLGFAYLSIGRYNDAYDALSRAFNGLHRDNALEQSSVLRAFGMLDHYRGRVEDSEAYQRRAYNDALKANNTRATAASQAQLGVLALERGDVHTALDMLNDVLTINRADDVVPYQVLDLRTIGLAHLVSLDVESALACFEEATTLLAETNRDDVLLQGYHGFALLVAKRRAQGKVLIENAYAQGSGSVYQRERLQLVRVAARYLLGDMVACRELAMSFLETIADKNRLLRARGLRWLGMATHRLGVAGAVSLLEEALDLEGRYGGRDVWLCAATLADYHEDPATAQAYAQQAADAIQARIDNLAAYPHLQATLRTDQRVQALLARSDDSSGK